MTELAGARAVLEVVGVTYAYAKARRPVLRDVSVTARAGEVVALVGPNGSGKSTLLKVAMGMLRGAGSARWTLSVGEGVEAREVGHWGRREFAQRVAFLPQHPEWTPGQTVMAAIAMGRYSRLGVLGIETDRDARVTFDAAAAMGLEEELDKRVDEISGGQRQRVFLARCLAQEPSVVVLDEPDTYLDLKHAVGLGRTLRKLARERGLTVVMASHDLHLAASVADRMVLMADGQVMAEGPPRAVMTEGKIRAAYGVEAVVWETGEMWGVGVRY